MKRVAGVLHDCHAAGSLCKIIYKHKTSEINFLINFFAYALNM